ncbi:MAG: DUF1223 domain-containing protein [Bryobacteraceae bacterium]
MAAANMAPHHSAVLVELFTSEGCSSCPSADSVLEALDRSQPESGVETVVLSEHVDYWNHTGWSDPYSSRRYSERQQVYAGRFRVESVYTPQMVVDGSTEFVGSDARRARASIQQAAQSQKVAVRLIPLERHSVETLRVEVRADALPAPLNAIEADVYLALAENEATSQVRGGENGGRRLHHVAVLRSLKLLGRISPGATFMKEVPIGLDNQTSPSQLRLVAFVQERGQGRVLGAVMRAAASPELSRR